MLVAIIVLMATVYYFNSERGMPLLITLVVLAFGVFRLSTREMVLAAGVVLAAYAAVINLLMVYRPETVNVYVEAYRWLGLAMVLPFFAFVVRRLPHLRHPPRQPHHDL